MTLLEARADFNHAFSGWITASVVLTATPVVVLVCFVVIWLLFCRRPKAPSELPNELPDEEPYSSVEEEGDEPSAELSGGGSVA